MKLNSVAHLCGCLTLACTVFVAETYGQVEKNPSPDAQWKTVQALMAGETVQIRLLKKGSVDGTLVSSTDTAVTLATKTGDVTTARSDIKELKVKKGSSEGKAALGAGIGVAAGVATAAILDGALTDGNGVSGSAVALFSVIGGAIGFVLSLGPSFKTIYKVR